MSKKLRLSAYIYATEDPALYSDLEGLSPVERGRRIRRLLSLGLAVETQTAIAAVPALIPPRNATQIAASLATETDSPVLNPFNGLDVNSITYARSGAKIT